MDRYVGLEVKLSPLVGEDEVDETRSVIGWSAWRAIQIMKGELKAQTKGGGGFCSNK